MGNDPVLTTDTTEYTVADLSQLFEDIGAFTTRDIYNYLDNDLSTLSIPDIPVYCFSGTGIDTVYSIDMSYGFQVGPTGFDFVDGDGVVPTDSANGCLRFNPVRTFNYEGVDHLGLVQRANIIQEFLDIVNPDPSRTPSPSRTIAQSSASTPSRTPAAPSNTPTPTSSRTIFPGDFSTYTTFTYTQYEYDTSISTVEQSSNDFTTITSFGFTSYVQESSSSASILAASILVMVMVMFI